MSGDLLPQRLDSILSFIEISVRQSAEFAADQAPDVVQQVLAWEFAYSLVWFVAGVLLAIAIVVAGVRGHRAIMAADMDREDTIFFHAMGGFLLLIPTLLSLMLIDSNIDWLQILISPKVYLLEYAATFLK